jgi:hypothetical protein
MWREHVLPIVVGRVYACVELAAEIVIEND